jgi:hypothetical protein
MARKKGEQTYNKDSQRRIDDLTQQNALQTNLAAGLEKLIKGQSGSADAAEKITERMLKQNDAAGKIKQSSTGVAVENLGNLRKNSYGRY